MEYTKEFKDAVKLGQYLGTGNPNSKILIVGKEVAINEPKDSFEKHNLKNYDNNVTDWQANIDSKIDETKIPKWDIDQYLQDPNATNNPLHLFKCVKLNDHKEGVTWRKYQKLYDVITTGTFNADLNRAYNFQTGFFLTELNDSPNKNTSNADKSTLENRKNMFEKSSFFNGFPVVILACSDYIWNTDNDRQIDRVFNVTYDGDESGRQIISKGNWFFKHSDKENSKLVIHTRQLSMGVKNDLILKMGLEIRDFLMQKGLLN